MNAPIPFRRRTLATFVAVACGSIPTLSQAAVNAGKVDYAVGNVTATGSDGQSRKIAKGAGIGVGDTIVTNAGRAWLRFRDGGYMSLQPGTEFRVDDYRFEDEEDGNERSFFSLLRGGMRAVTGLVGRTNRQNYRVNTPVATIGIRGTEYLAQLGNSLTVSCGEGICVVTNEVDEVVLQAGETVYFEDETSKGERRARKVVLPPSAPDEDEFEVGENRADDGSLPDFPEPGPEPPEFSADVPLVPGEQSGLFLALSYGGDGGECCFNMEHDALVGEGTAPDYVTALLNGNLALEQASWNPSVQRNGAAFADTDTDGIIAWGRWTDGTATGTVFENGQLVLGNNGGNQSVHYFTGVPTPEGDLLNLKSQGVAAVYNLIGATTPTFGDDGFEGQSDFGDIVKITGALAANFANSTAQTSLVLDFTNEDVTITSGAMPIAARTGGTFGGTGNWASSTLNMSTNYQTKIAGFFAGGAASRAGYGYDVYVTDSGGYTINGVVAFMKGGSASQINFSPPAVAE